jgi:large conductance mechanosensitive channel
MLKEFKAFVMRGNLIELATAFILGVAFAAVVTGFTDMVLGAISYVVGGDVSFDALGVHKGINGPIVIPYGHFLTTLVSFLLVAWVLFLVVKAYNRAAQEKEADPTTKPCQFCMTDIALDATRCPNCTSYLEEASAS